MGVETLCHSLVPADYVPLRDLIHFGCSIDESAAAGRQGSEGPVGFSVDLPAKDFKHLAHLAMALPAKGNGVPAKDQDSVQLQ